MLLLFHEAAANVNSLLLQNRVSQKTLDEHRRCVESLGAYLDNCHLDFSEAHIITWLEKIKKRLSYDSFCRYRRAAYRILKYETTGSIEATCGMFDRYAYQYYDSGKPFVSLSPYFKEIFQNYMTDGEKRLSPFTMYHYRIPVSEFLKLLEEDGVSSVSEIRISHLENIRLFFDSKDISDDKKAKSGSAVGDFIKTISSNGIPWCYRYYMKVIGAADDIPIFEEQDLSGLLRSDKPSLALDAAFVAFSDEMERRRYACGFSNSY